MRKGAAEVGNPAHLVCLERFAITVVWTLQILHAFCLLFSKGFNPNGLVYMQLTMCGLILGIISIVFLIYGLRMLSRLRTYERQQKLRMPSIRTDHMLSNRSFDMNVSDDEDDTPKMKKAGKAMRSRPKKGHAARIRTILLVVEAVSLAVIVGQVYTAINETNSPPIELSCANGKLCQRFKCKVNLLNVFQLMCLWVILWTFRKTPKNDVVPKPQTIV